MARTFNRLRLCLRVCLCMLVSLVAGCNGERASTSTQRAPEQLSVNAEDPAWISRDTAKPNKVAVVFIHGIFGSTTGTWSNSNGATFFSLLKAAPGVGPDVDIYAFGFESKMFGGKGSLDVREAANKLGLYLRSAEVLKYDTVVLVGHSMGGLVALRYVASNAPNDAELASKIPLIALYGTPMEGAQIAGMGKLALENPGLASMLPADDNQWLQQLLDDWVNLKKKPRVVCAYEKAPTHGVMVVPWTSSTRLCTEPGIAIGGADHISMVKPDRQQHESVVLLVDSMRSVIEGGTARLEVPDFEKVSDGWRVTMNSPDKQARIMNIGRGELSYWVSEIVGSGLFVVPNEGAKTVSGGQVDNLHVLLLLNASAADYSFRIKTKQGDDLLVRIDADLEQLRARRAMLADQVVTDLNAQLSTANAGTTSHDGLAAIAAQRIEKEYPGLPADARWIVAADVLSSASLENEANAALRRAREMSPGRAKDYAEQKAMLKRPIGLDRDGLRDTQSKPAADRPDPSPDTPARFSAQGPGTGDWGSSKQKYDELATRLKLTRGLEDSGRRLDFKLKSLDDPSRAKLSTLRAEKEGLAEKAGKPVNLEPPSGR